MTSPQETEYVLTLACPDARGLVHQVSTWLMESHANVIDSDQFGDPSTAQFFMRVHFSTALERAALETSFREVGQRNEMRWELGSMSRRPRVLIMVSKADHCLVDLLYRMRREELDIDVPLVVSNHRDTYGLVASHDIDFLHLPVTPESKAEVEQRIADEIAAREIDFVVLARYMQILTADFCAQFPERIINIHHSFLPGFKGAKPYHQAHERGVKLIGATAHYVTSDLDEGPIIEQDVRRVDHRMSPPELVAAGRDVERMVLARAVRWKAERRILANGRKTVVFA